MQSYRGMPSFGQVADDKSKGKDEAKGFIGVSMKKSKQQSKQLGLASLSGFGGLWIIMVVSSCLVPNPGIIQSEEYCFLGCMGPERRFGSEIVSLHIKGILPTESFAVSKHWLAPGGTDSPQPESFLR